VAVPRSEGLGTGAAGGRLPPPIRSLGWRGKGRGFTSPRNAQEGANYLDSLCSALQPSWISRPASVGSFSFGRWDASASGNNLHIVSKYLLRNVWYPEGSREDSLRDPKMNPSAAPSTRRGHLASAGRQAGLAALEEGTNEVEHDDQG
jgi:hypothetical protein